jgi:predicted aldo/keto reductase-like oxidoreductase
MNRRNFLKTSVLTATAAASTALPVSAKQEKPTVKKYNQLGKTNLKMSDISFGAGKIPSPSMMLRAVDRGINYFDTAPDYGTSEAYIGEAMRKIKRDKITIATKFCRHGSYPGHLPSDAKKKDYISAVESSLSRLNTNYLDIVFVHAIGEKNKKMETETKRLMSEEMLMAVNELKKQGKMKYLAVSSHGPDNMEDLLMKAVTSGHYDIIMPAFNFMKFPRIPDVIKEAHKRGVGVVAMKTLAGAKDMNFDPKGEEFAPAAFKWVLKHKEVSGLVITIKTVSDLDLYLTASGQGFTASDQAALDRYALRYGKEYCRTGCNSCESACPYGVQIATIMRYYMYFNDYGMEKYAMQSYASLSDNAQLCHTCSTGSCTGACPYGLSVSVFLKEAHKKLIFNV